MANIFCSSTGSNTSPYETWAKAATTFTTAVGAATASGDVIAVDATNPPADIAADTTWTFVANVNVIASTNSGTSTITPTTMGTSAYLGASGATSYSLKMTGAFKVYFYGITLRNSGSTAKTITLCSADGAHYEYENCYIWLGTTAATRIYSSDAFAASQNIFIKLKGCTIRFGGTGGAFSIGYQSEFENCAISPAGSAPSQLFASYAPTQSRLLVGCDLSHVTNTLFGDDSTGAAINYLTQCKLGAGVTVQTAQTTHTNKSSAKTVVHDCSGGDTHGLFGYYDAFGSLTSDTGIYYTTGAAAQSWKIVTTANCSFSTPFVTPWINLYNTGTSAITPYLEILRDGSATAFKDSEVWLEVSVKDQSGFTNTTLFSDRQALVDWAAGTAGAAQANGAGLGSWTGESGTAWSGKIDSGSAVTPAEAGHIRARVVVGARSITVYVDPQIRT